MKILTKKQKRDIAALAKLKDSEIDLSDMPEALDWSKAEIGKFYQGKKTVVPQRKSGRVRIRRMQS